jgi:hypothetical protein
MPPTPPRQSRHRESSQDVSIRAVGSPNIYPEVFAALGFIVSDMCSSAQQPNQNHNLSFLCYVNYQCANDDTVVHSLTPSRSQVLVPASPGGAGAGAGGGSSDMGMMPPGKPLWRKREVVRSERIVHYTTVDASGLLQVTSILHLVWYKRHGNDAKLPFSRSWWRKRARRQKFSIWSAGKRESLRIAKLQSMSSWRPSTTRYRS